MSTTTDRLGRGGIDAGDLQKVWSDRAMEPLTYVFMSTSFSIVGPVDAVERLKVSCHAYILTNSEYFHSKQRESDRLRHSTFVFVRPSPLKARIVSLVEAPSAISVRNQFKSSSWRASFTPTFAKSVGSKLNRLALGLLVVIKHSGAKSTSKPK